MGIEDLDQLIRGSYYNLKQKGTSNVIPVEFIQTTPGGGIKVRILKNSNVMILPDALDKFEIISRSNIDRSYYDGYVDTLGGSRRRAYGGRKRKTRCKKLSKRRCRKSSRRRR